MKERYAEDITWIFNCRHNPDENYKLINMALGVILSHRQRRSVSSSRKSERFEEVVSSKPFGHEGPAKVSRITFKDCILEYTDEFDFWKLEIYLCWDTYPNNVRQEKETERPTRFEVIITEPETKPEEFTTPFEDDDEDES
jgi:hypothetical protein